MNEIWRTMPADAAFRELGSAEGGLSENEAQVRLQKFGLNKLPEAKVDGLWVIFWRQFQSPLIYILLAACASVFLLKEWVDGSIILAVLIFNAIVGTIQEGKAQNTLSALKKFAQTNATVLRSGEEMIVPDYEVVAGDVIILEEGEKIPADARVIFANNLMIDESALTGESEPVHKNGDPVTAPSPEMRNIVFKATNITSGKGRAVVFATGTDTVIGEIASKIKNIDTEVPLKNNIRYLSRVIIVAVLLISVFLFIAGAFRGEPLLAMFETVVSLAVSIVPEGLPIVVTLILALGVWRMGKRHALVKKLEAVEALGQARVIAVDKTGTLTKNELNIKKAYLDEDFFEVEGDGYEPSGKIRRNGQNITAGDVPVLMLAGAMAAYSANAEVMFIEEERRWRVSGDPTEAALKVFAEKLGQKRGELTNASPIIAELPFDYKLKYHATEFSYQGKKMVAVLGAPEVILNLSSKIYHAGGAKELSGEKKKQLEDIFSKMSEEGMRVIALAKLAEFDGDLNAAAVKNLTFIGFFGMTDTIREEVADAMKKAELSGVRVVMLTGDHKITAVSIAKEAGIYKEGDIVLTGEDIDAISTRELADKLSPRLSVFARVNPEHKLSIVKAFRLRGDIIAMTGDGVNDAPSLVAADLGVAMGNIGTAVAKEAADIVLLDDNFGSIISAIEEGRSIYRTIKKVILYLFSTSLGEVLTISGSLFVGFPLPILPAQIIWLNFVTDGFLDVSLAMEPKDGGLLTDRFERPRKILVDGLMAKRMINMALPMAIGTLIIFGAYYGPSMTKAYTVSLTLLAAFQWFNAWNCRSDKISIFKMNPFSNKFLLVSTGVIIFLQLLAIYNPLMQGLLHTTALSIFDWLIIIPIASSIVVVEEIRKYKARKKAETSH